MKLIALLREIGYGGASSYEIPKEPSDSYGDIYDPDQDGHVIYRFEAKEPGQDSMTYDVVLSGMKSEEGEYFLDVEYTADGTYSMTNMGKPLKIMATVAKIVKQVVDADKEVTNLQV